MTKPTRNISSVILCLIQEMGADQSWETIREKGHGLDNFSLETGGWEPKGKSERWTETIWTISGIWRTEEKTRIRDESMRREQFKKSHLTY